MEFFDAKFSEALKTVGKKFDFVQLYTERETFKDEILQIIGTDLNGYVLDDAAIDYLEQTDINLLNSKNILDSEGIKKITELTSQQLILANQIEQDKEKTIKKQNVSAREAILELEKQNAEAEAKQKREIAIIHAREEAEAEKVRQEERYKAEMARVKADEEIEVAEQNKQRQVIALKSKESTEAIESERVDKKRLLEKTDKEKLVELASIAKEKEVEVEKKNIQLIIRERVAVEKDTVIEEEKIKDTRAIAEAERLKAVAIKKAEEESEKNLIIEVKTAEASKQAAEKIAEKTIIDADAKYKASQKEAEAIKILVDANVLEESTSGIAEAKVIEAKASAEAKAIEAKALAQVKGDTAMVDVKEKEGTVEADILKKKYMAEAEGIKEKANSMKALDEVGRGHEEFKLKLEKDKEIQLANINIQKEIAESQASVIREALKTAKIDIVGGETMFFDQIIGSISKGKSYDRLVENSDVLTDIKETFITGDPEYFKKQVQEFVDKFNLTSEDIKNLSIAGAINKMMGNAKGEDKVALSKLLDTVNKAGVAKLPAKTIEIINE